MKLTTAPATYFKVLLIAFIIFIPAWLFAAPKPGTYKVTIKTTQGKYKKYLISSITDSTIIIYKQKTAGTDTIIQNISLNADQIKHILMLPSHRFRPYLISAGALTILGVIFGAYIVYNDPGQNPGNNLGPDLAAGALIFEPIAGFLTGIGIGGIIDAGRIHNYNINRRHAAFQKFSQEWK